MHCTLQAATLVCRGMPRQLVLWSLVMPPSPIDLIRDFIPVLGYLDDLILVPSRILLAIRLIPPVIMAEHRILAAAHARPMSRVAAMAIIGIVSDDLRIASTSAFRMRLAQGYKPLHIIE